MNLLIAKISAAHNGLVVVRNADVRAFLRVKTDNGTPALAISAAAVGGADRDRTDDPLLAKQVLSQLSYSPGSEVLSPEC